MRTPQTPVQLWRAVWEGIPDLEDRKTAAAAHWTLAARALAAHAAAHRADLNAHREGVQAVALLMLREHLQLATGRALEAVPTDDVFDLIPAVRVAARAARAYATLALLSVVTGDQTSLDVHRTVADHCRAAASDPDALADLLDTLRLFELLGFRAALTAAAIAAAA